MFERVGQANNELPRGLSNPIKNKDFKDASFAQPETLSDMFDLEAVKESL